MTHARTPAAGSRSPYHTLLWQLLWQLLRAPNAYVHAYRRTWRRVQKQRVFSILERRLMRSLLPRSYAIRGFGVIARRAKPAPSVARGGSPCPKTGTLACWVSQLRKPCYSRDFSPTKARNSFDTSCARQSEITLTFGNATNSDAFQG